MLSTTVLLATLVYAGLGIIIFAVGFWIWDRLSPEDLWGELCRGNQAIGNFAGAMAIAIAIIIAAAIHG